MDSESLEIALVENLQRENLSPLEEAKGYQRLIDEYDHTQEALGQMRSQTRQYARRQLTWFRHQLPDDAMHVDTSRPLDAQAADVVAAWKTKERSIDG